MPAALLAAGPPLRARLLVALLVARLLLAAALPPVPPLGAGIRCRPS